MRIEACDFGSITIDGVTYRSDLKIVAGQVVEGWWRKEGHNLLLADIQDILEARPEVLVVGQGDPGLMVISEEVTVRLRELGIELIAQPTRQACQTFNSILPTRNTAFAAHLTC